jgi:hypothetical protein
MVKINFFALLALTLLVSGCEEDDPTYCLSKKQPNYVQEIRANPTRFIPRGTPPNQITLRDSTDGSFQIASIQKTSCSSESRKLSELITKLSHLTAQIDRPVISCEIVYDGASITDSINHLTVLAYMGIRGASASGSTDTTNGQPVHEDWIHIDAHEACTTLLPVQKALIKSEPKSVTEPAMRSAP